MPNESSCGAAEWSDPLPTTAWPEFMNVISPYRSGGAEPNLEMLQCDKPKLLISFDFTKKGPGDPVHPSLDA